MILKDWLLPAGHAIGDHPFDRSGLASVQDLDVEHWKPLFAELEAIQAEFSASAPWSPEYIYPREPLHTWSRVWEYPYAYHHIRRWRQGLSREAQPSVLDFGSGVTFFPFAVARLGCNVVCGDIDPTCEGSILLATSRVSTKPGEVMFKLLHGPQLPFRAGSFDLVFSISVVEHVPEPAGLVEELWRVLGRDGMLILTFDVDLDSGSELGLGEQRYQRLMDALGERFSLAQPRVEVHPTSLLTTRRGPFPQYARPSYGLRYSREARYYLKQYVIRPLLGREPVGRWNLACEGLILKVRGYEAHEKSARFARWPLGHTSGSRGRNTAA